MVVDRLDQPVVDRGVEHDGGRLRDLPLVEGPERGQQLAAAEDGVERGDLPVARRRAVGDRQPDAPLGGPFGDPHQHPQGRPVEPLGVVDHQRRAGVREVVEQGGAPGPLVRFVDEAGHRVGQRTEVVPGLEAPAGETDHRHVPVAPAVDDRSDDRAGASRARSHDAELRRPAAVGHC